MKRTSFVEFTVSFMLLEHIELCPAVGNECLSKQLQLCLSRCVDTSCTDVSEKSSNAV